jgi:hypothetical protein
MQQMESTGFGLQSLGQAGRGIHVPKIYTLLASGACNILYPFSQAASWDFIHTLKHNFGVVYPTELLVGQPAARIACSDV